MNIRKKFVFQQALSIKSGAKTKKITGSQGEKLAKHGIKTTAVTQKKYNKNMETLLAKQIFPPYLRQAAKIYVATSNSVVRQETIEISEQRTAFVWFFAQEVDWCMKDCDKQRLQTTVSINLWKILAGHTGDWFDVKTASIRTTELWDALKSFILTSLKFKVAPYPIKVPLDVSTTVMTIWEMRKEKCKFWQGKVWTQRQFQCDNGDNTSVSLTPALYQ